MKYLCTLEFCHSPKLIAELSRQSYQFCHRSQQVSSAETKTEFFTVGLVEWRRGASTSVVSEVYRQHLTTFRTFV